MKVGAWLESHPAMPLTVPADWSLEKTLDRLLATPEAHDAYVVDEANRVIGHLGRSKLAHLLFAEHRPVHTRRQLMHRVAGATAREAMSRHFATAHSDEDLDGVLHRMLEHEVEDLPVVDDDGILRGAVKLGALLRWFRAPPRSC